MQYVSLAANILETSEYEVLRRGYADWYGHAPAPTLIDAAFSRYLFTQESPHWARHYALRVVNDFEAARAERREWTRLVLAMLFCVDCGGRGEGLLA